jgi:hypothetical protein
MKNILVLLLFLSSLGIAEVLHSSVVATIPIVTLPITKPIQRPTKVIIQENHYNTEYTSNCTAYITIIAQKDAEIVALKAELHTLKDKEQKKLQKELSDSYDKAVDKFDTQKSSVKTTNSIIISNKP